MWAPLGARGVLVATAFNQVQSLPCSLGSFNKRCIQESLQPTRTSPRKAASFCFWKGFKKQLNP